MCSPSLWVCLIWTQKWIAHAVLCRWLLQFSITLPKPIHVAACTALPLLPHYMKRAQFVYPPAPLMDSWSFVSSIFHSPKQCWHRAQRWAFHSKTCSTVLLGMHTWSAGSYGNPMPNFSRAHLKAPIVTASFTYSPVEPHMHVWGPLEGFTQIRGTWGNKKPTRFHEGASSGFIWLGLTSL